MLPLPNAHLRGLRRNSGAASGLGDTARLLARQARFAA